MQTDGKVWGISRLLLQTGAIEIHRITVDEGGFCSKHRHQSKQNAFYVLSGKLEISRWKKGMTDRTMLHENEVLVTSLHENELCVIPPGEYHLFRAAEKSEVLEIYWSELNHEDIERATVGGRTRHPDLFETKQKEEWAAESQDISPRKPSFQKEEGEYPKDH